jgi:hypothetical protein
MPTTETFPPIVTRTPTPAPTTSRPTAAPLEVEAATFAQLEAAVAQAAASGVSLTVSLVVGIVMTGMLKIFSPMTLRSMTTTQMFWVRSSGQLSGTNITLRDGYTSDYGGAVYVETGGAL